MSYNLTWNVTVAAQIDAQPYGVSKNGNFLLTSSNAIQQTVTTTGSNYSFLSVGQLQNCVGISAYNDNSVYSSSVVVLAYNGAVLSTIQPGQVAAIPWSGSLNSLSASATALNTASVQYTLFQA